MITSSQARSMAETNWGRGGTTARRTNRKGAYYFSCSGHGGFVIDGRCLTDRERALFERFLGAQTAIEILRADGTVRRMRGPMSRQNPGYYPSRGESCREVGIFFAEEDCDWAVAVAFADIRVEGMTRKDAIDSLLRLNDISNHERVALGLADPALADSGPGGSGPGDPGPAGPGLVETASA